MKELEKMATLERELEKRFEKMCEKNGWSATAYLKIGGEEATLMLDKLAEAQITAGDRETAKSAIREFILSELGVKDIVENDMFKTDEEVIPHTRAPYHVTVMARVDASAWIAKAA